MGLNMLAQLMSGRALEFEGSEFPMPTTPNHFMLSFFFNSDRPRIILSFTSKLQAQSLTIIG
jgi:hypothetical protein